MQELLIDFEDYEELYRCYMPFLSSGGLFVKTSAYFAMGEKVQLKVTLPESLDVYEVEGVVAWKTPQGSQSTGKAGIGVSFVEADIFNELLIRLLGTMLNSDKPTYTM
ncbi:PilZ domain-containing protein [Pseudoalteromonas sp. T1lg65]|uniref:PilZ domain-containing protein n=1 Tax=Pseudoalteromonas sp. T1lg65 TaxID=2077101 RepID=UPI003F7908ED